MSVLDIAILLGRVVVCCVIGLAMVCGHRWIRTRSRALGWLTAAGFLARATIGLVLFWVSYVDVAALRQLHMGNGFWRLAVDALIYYEIVLEALDKGLGSIVDTGASPAYTRTLTVWMSLVGVSPASGFFLNLTLYVALGMLITWWNQRSDGEATLPSLISFGAFSFSPVLLIHGSQPLKDEFFAFLIALSCIASLALLVPLVRGRATTAETWLASAGFVVLLAATYLMAGIRSYFSFILWGSMALTLGVFVLWQRPPARLLRYVPAAAAILVLLWTVAVSGGGRYTTVPVSMAQSLLPGWAAALAGPSRKQLRQPAEGSLGEAVSMASSVVAASRDGFEQTGGATNVTSWRQPKPTPASALPAPDKKPGAAATSGMAEAEAPGGLQDVTRTRAAAQQPQAGALGQPTPPASPIDKLTLGLSLLFVPMSVLRSAGLVEIEGGRGLLPVADLDTVFLDLSLLAVLGLLVARRSTARENLPYLVFVLCVAIATAGLMAYIVTNFGTLFRLRLMLAVPFWMAPLALCARKTTVTAAQQSPIAGGIGRPPGWRRWVPPFRSSGVLDLGSTSESHPTDAAMPVSMKTGR